MRPCSCADLGVTALAESDVRSPTSGPPRQASSFIFSVEVRRCTLQQRGIKALEGVHIDHRIRIAGDNARSDRHRSARGADVKVCRLRTEGVLTQAGGVGYFDQEASSWARRPDIAVLLAEPTATSSGRHLDRFGLPVELELDVATVAGAVNEHSESTVLVVTPNEAVEKSLRGRGMHFSGVP